MIEILEDTHGNLSVWRDVYEWVDPFAEAEEWALRWADERRNSDTTRLREAHEHEVKVLRAQFDALLRTATQLAATQQPPQMVQHIDGDPRNLDLTNLKLVKDQS